MNKEQIKLCAVCDDYAIAKNFNVWSCKACKAFFRRNANRQLRCDYQNKCEVNINTRSYCMKCRLEKCFAVGMRKDYILTDEMKAFRKINSKKKLKNIKANNIAINDKIINNLSRSEEEPMIDDSTDLGLVDQSTEQVTQQDIEELEQIVEVNEIVTNSIEQAKVNWVIPRTIESNNERNNTFNPMEFYKLMEILTVVKSLEINVNKCSNVKLNLTLQDCFLHGGYFYEHHTRKFIKTIKGLNSFDAINKADRLTLVKYSAMEIIILRSVLRYDHDEESWKYPSHDDIRKIKLETLKALHYEYSPVYTNSWNSIVKECHNDYIIINLLTAISLFNPNRPKLIDSDSIINQQRIYTHLLQRYFSFKYRTQSQSSEQFNRCLNVLTFSNIIGQLEKRYTFEPNHQICSPLLKEILDFNSK